MREKERQTERQREIDRRERERRIFLDNVLVHALVLTV